MIGILLSFVKNMMWLGFNLIESIILTIAYNSFAPRINDIYLASVQWKLPFVHVQYWHVFAFLILVHYVGVIINNITPKFVNINTTQNTGKENK